MALPVGPRFKQWLDKKHHKPSYRLHYSAFDLKTGIIKYIPYFILKKLIYWQNIYKTAAYHKSLTNTRWLFRNTTCACLSITNLLSFRCYNDGSSVSTLSHFKSLHLTTLYSPEHTQGPIQPGHKLLQLFWSQWSCVSCNQGWICLLVFNNLSVLQPHEVPTPSQAHFPCYLEEQSQVSQLCTALYVGQLKYSTALVWH